MSYCNEVLAIRLESLSAISERRSIMGEERRRSIIERIAFVFLLPWKCPSGRKISSVGSMFYSLRYSVKRNSYSCAIHCDKRGNEFQWAAPSFSL